jgi:hypothetical protein
MGGGIREKPNSTPLFVAVRGTAIGGDRRSGGWYIPGMMPPGSVTRPRQLRDERQARSAAFSEVKHQLLRGAVRWLAVSRPSWPLATIAAGLLLAAGFRPAAADGPAAPAAPADAATDEAVRREIDGWIEDLAAEQFAQREAASKSLAAAGARAVGPVQTAIGRGDLEISSRGVEILRLILEGEDLAAAERAERALEELAEEDDATISRLAGTTLDFHTLGMAESARAKVESLGAVVTEGFLPSGRRGLHVIVNAGWRGTWEDFRLLARMRGVAHLGLHGLKLEPPGLAVLGRMRGIERLELYGTKADEAAVTTLKEKLAPAVIDWRKGAKLGVAGTPGVIGPCVLNHVQEGSAASRAGIQIGDVVLEIDGVAVHNFEALTERVGRREPGEKIELKVERSLPGRPPERFSRTVELGGWE